MDFMEILDLKDEMTPDLILKNLKILYADRAPEGTTPRGDIQVLRPEFISYGDNTVRVKFPVEQWQLNGIDILQGGVMSYMMDCVLGSMTYVHSGGPVATIDMTANYLKAVSLKDPYVVVEARILNETRTMLHAFAKLENSAGETAVTATSNIMKLKRK